VSTLSQIRGQPRALAILRQAMAMDRVAHAYLFCGPAGCGKHTTGLALAAALNCERTPGEGCGTCGPCEKIAAGIHPDVRTLERQGASQTIPIETIRTQVIPVLAMRPHEGRARMFLIEEASALQGASANALLKTLEEPPPRTHFVLSTTSPQQLLPTIRSRCQRINFAALATDLRAQIHSDSESAEALDALVQSLRNAAQQHDFESLQNAASQVSSAKEHLGPALDLLAERLHQDARTAACDHALDRAALLGRQATAVLDTRTALAQSAHGQIALEALLHTLRTTL
jgi:DNA polymerase III subunit delta'